MAVASRAVRAPGRRRAQAELASILVGAAIALALLQLAFRASHQRFDELALGRETVSYYAEVEGHPIHCRTLADVARCLEGHAARGSPPAVLWLGNSQVHAINQRQPGQDNAPPLLFRRLGDRGLDLLTLSQPNANLQEHLVLYAYLQARLRPRALLLPVVFDDLREIGLREEIATGLEDPAVLDVLGRHEVGGQILDRFGQQAGGDLAALDQTVQEHTEAYLTSWLEDHSRLWALRRQARGTLFTNLYRLRNSLFGITAQSKRRMIPGRMELNLLAAEALLEEANRAGTLSLVYVIPLRSDVETPYVEREYLAFKRQIRELAEGRGAVFANLEDVVPARHWGHQASGTTDDGTELDFMHFQSHGHELLADALGDLLDEHLAGSAAP